MTAVEDDEVVEVKTGWGDFYPLTAAVDQYIVAGLTAEGWMNRRQLPCTAGGGKPLLRCKRATTYAAIKAASRAAGNTLPE